MQRKTEETKSDTQGQLPEWLTLPENLAGADVDTLAKRYILLSECKERGEGRVGRHPSGHNNPEEVEPDPYVRAVLDAGLSAMVREMAAVHYALHQKPGGLMALLARNQKLPDPPQV